MQFKQGLIVTTLLELSYAQLIRSRQADDMREEMVNHLVSGVTLSMPAAF